MTIEKITKELRVLFWSVLVCAAIIAAVYELGIAESGILAVSKDIEFMVLTAVELLTIITIPCALRLFKSNKVRKALADKREEALRRFSILRMFLLEGPLLLNVFLYYIFMQPSFGYMAIIVLFCLAFVYPSKDRCNRELDINDGE